MKELIFVQPTTEWKIFCISNIFQSAFSCSQLTAETLEKFVKYVQSQQQ